MKANTKIPQAISEEELRKEHSQFIDELRELSLKLFKRYGQCEHLKIEINIDKKSESININLYIFNL